MYTAPVDEIIFTLKQVAGLAPALRDGAFPGLEEDVADAVLHEAGRFAATGIAPLAETGDRQGARLTDDAVTLPDGWADLYRRWAAAGWNGLTGAEAYGGQGLPHMLNVAAFEMWNAASLAFAIGPTLTVGAVEALEHHASDALKALYLPRLVSGEWMATMNLTEPQAGSDLAALRARAERANDGSYRIFGQKIFITWGEHDATDNIVHLVLARLPDAPAGTRGISLFLVPKFLPDPHGNPGMRNDVFCQSLEHKLGIHGSPTCVMIYGDGRYGAEKGAIGYLVGEEHKGLACMFTMMNNARLLVGIQGVAIAEAATQKALAYAGERLQGRAPGFSGEAMSPIRDHPDVRRMLLTMKALTQGARAIAYACAHAIDFSGRDIPDAKHWQERAALLTPVAKAFSTDIGVEVASLGLQVHGGMGYIEETGAARLLRDARIAPIYEGTNGIQAIDLVTRKLPLSQGGHVHGFIAELRDIAAQAAACDLDGLGDTAARLEAALADLSEAAEWLLAKQASKDVTAALSGATPFLRLFGLALTGCYLARGALVAGAGQPGRIALCRFAAENLLCETAALKDRIIHGSESLSAAAFLLA